MSDDLLPLKYAFILIHFYPPKDPEEPSMEDIAQFLNWKFGLQWEARYLEKRYLQIKEANRKERERNKAEWTKAFVRDLYGNNFPIEDTFSNAVKEYQNFKNGPTYSDSLMQGTPPGSATLLHSATTFARNPGVLYRSEQTSFDRIYDDTYGKSKSPGIPIHPGYKVTANNAVKTSLGRAATMEKEHREREPKKDW